MTVIVSEIRRGAYYDSIVLMRLQAALLNEAGISNAAAMMGSAVNKDLMRQSGLLTSEAESARPDDLIITVAAEGQGGARAALARIDPLLSERTADLEQDYRPKSLSAAAGMLPEARWVLISVPGNYAASVARQALELEKHVFLYSDNVSVADEVALKTEAASKGLLVMGPDCGTVMINGVGLGFANVVRRGPIGLVAASGTGLQQVATQIHQLGSGITHAIGTGGRDLTEAVGGVTALQSLEMLSKDSETSVIVLISKPPSQQVAAKLLEAARRSGKAVVISFLGYPAVGKNTVDSNLHFAASLDEAAQLAVDLSQSPVVTPSESEASTAEPRYLRALFSGGTLAQEALLTLSRSLPEISANMALAGARRLEDLSRSCGHTILDLGEDEFTVGRPHPMLDNSLRLQRLTQEAADPETGVILLDVVLGYGAHANPAAELAPAISSALALAAQKERELKIVVLLVGTDEDPQDFESQSEQLRIAGAVVETRVAEVCARVVESLPQGRSENRHKPVDVSVLREPLVAINVGVESFAQSVSEQGATVTHVDWRPPAGGNENLLSILERMKRR